MKYVLRLSLPGFCLVCLLVAPSCSILGGPPRQLQVGADETGIGVLLVWDTPTEGTPDEYLVYFRPREDTAYEQIDKTTAINSQHDPQGQTGDYKVEARFGADAYASAKATTIPVHTRTAVLYELNAAGFSGFGWDSAGKGHAYSMLDAANAESVYFYITDFTPSSERIPYAIASPDTAPFDSGGIVPEAGWRRVGFSDSIPHSRENQPLPEPTSVPFNYYNLTQITSTPMLVGVFSPADERYALVRIEKVDPSMGEVSIETWCQPVKRLRLIGHEIDRAGS
jgi:hypothetical protein